MTTPLPPRNALGQFTRGGGGNSLTFSLFGIDVSASSTLRSVAREAARTGDILTKLTAGTVAAGGAMSSFLSVGAGVGQVLAAAAPAALLAAPAMTTLAQGMGVLALASEGVTEQFEQLTPELTDLRAVAAEGVRGGIQDLITSLRTSLPTVREGVRETAKVFGDLASQAGKAFSGAGFRADLRTVMSANAEVIGNVGQAVIGLGRAFVDVAAVGAPMLSVLSGALVEGAEKIRAWVAEARESGKLQQLISQGLSVLGDIGAIVGNVFGSLVNIFGAVGSSAVVMLEPIRDITQAIQNWTSIPENLAPLRSMVDGLRAGISGLVDALGTGLSTLGPVLGDLFVNIGSALQQVLPVVGALAGQLVSALLPVITALVPPLAQFAVTLGSVLADTVRDLSPILAQVGDALGDIFIALAPLLPSLGSLVSSVLSLAGPLAALIAELAAGLLPIFGALIPVLTDAAEIVGGVLLEVLGALLDGLRPLMPVLADMARTVGAALVEALSRAAPALVAVAGAVASLLPSLIPLIPAIVDVATALLPLMPMIVQFAAHLATELVPILTPLIDLLTEAARILADTLIENLDQVIPAFRDLTDAVLQLIPQLAPLIPIVVDLVESVLPLLPAFSGLAVTIGTSLASVLVAVAPLITALAEIFVRLADIASTVVVPALSALVAVVRFLGEDVIGGLLQGMANILSGLYGWMNENIVQPFLRFFRSLFGISSPSTVMAGLGADVIQGMLNGMLGVAQTIGSWLTNNVFNPVVRFFGNAKSWLWQAGDDIIRGMVGGMLGVLNGIYGWIKRNVYDRIVGAVKSLFGISSPSTVMMGIGGNLIEGLLRGVVFSAKNAPTVLKKSLGGLGDIAKAVLSGAGGFLDKIGITKFFGGLGGVLGDIGGFFAGLFGGGPSMKGLPSSVTRWSGVAAAVLGELGQSLSWLPLLLKRMNQESGGNPYAINLWDCVDLSTMILTRRGWLKHDQVEVGDETIGYNMATGRSEWTRITRIVHYEDAELVRVGNKRWSVVCTPNHRWVTVTKSRNYGDLTESCWLCDWPAATRRRGKTTEGGLAVHLGKVHGVQLDYGYNHQFGFGATEHLSLTGHTGIVVSAKADTGPGLPVSDDEAELLGWIIGDGHLECPSRGRGSIRIGQAKPDGISALRALVERRDVPHTWYDNGRHAPLRPGRQRVITIRLSLEYAQDLLTRSGYLDHVSMVVRMSATQRAAFLRGVVAAEGTAQNTGGERGGNLTMIPQKYGAKYDAIKLAVYLCGYRPSMSDRSEYDTSNGWAPSGAIGTCRPRITPRTRDRVGRGPVWCVTTDLGSWTAEQDGHVFLTGNSNAKRGDPSRGLMQTIMGTFLTYAGKYAGRGIYDPYANIYAATRYTLSRYRTLAAWGRPGGYDQGGWLMPGWTLAVNKTGEPELITPMDKLRQGGGGDHYHVHLYGTVVLGGSKAQAARELRSMFRDSLRDDGKHEAAAML